MKKEKKFPDVRFTPEVIRKGKEVVATYLEEEDEQYLSSSLYIVLSSGETWDHDNEDEFFADYRSEHKYSMYKYGSRSYEISVQYVSSDSRTTRLSVRARSRQEIEAIFGIFEENAPRCKLPPMPKDQAAVPKPRVFIGHGQSTQWRDLKDHLHEKHGYDVEAYEVGVRAGHTIRDILDDMLTKSSIAILVMTGEDATEEGHLRARQNVIHELGLFQGRVGFSRAIILLEEGTEEFSNIHGINQIRFGNQNIKETFGEVLATLRREFAQ